MRIPSHKKATTLIETVLVIGVMLLVFLSLSAFLKLTLGLLYESKAKIGAYTVAMKHMEYLNSLSYENLGVKNSVPNGSIPQKQEKEYNGVKYTLRNVILYKDDPQDGLAEKDQNGIITDYKIAKVELSWKNPSGQQRKKYFVTYFSPPDEETGESGGILRLFVKDAELNPVPSAEINIKNYEITPIVDTTFYTDTEGKIEFVGLKPDSNYEIYVTKPNYSYDKTYKATTENPNPFQRPLSVFLNKVTEKVFQIDLLSKFKLYSYRLDKSNFNDTFSSTSSIEYMDNLYASSSKLFLQNTTTQATLITKPISPNNLNMWDSFEIFASDNLNYKVYFLDESGNLIPDTYFPGNLAGFSNNLITLKMLDPDKYKKIKVKFEISSDSVSEYLDGYKLNYYVSYSLPSVSAHLISKKAIGMKAGVPVPKHDISTTTDNTGKKELEVEWGQYDIDFSKSSHTLGYICPSFSPYIAPGQEESIKAYLLPSAVASSSVIVEIEDDSKSKVAHAKVSLYNNGHNFDTYSNSCGSAFFENVPNGSYTMKVEKQGYKTATDTISVSNSVEKTKIIIFKQQGN